MKKLDKIKLGFIGMGRRSNVLLETVLKIFTDVEVVAVCDLYIDRAELVRKELEKQYNVYVKSYVDYKDLLNDNEVNTVIIAASWESHVVIAVDCMKAGKVTALEVGGAYSEEDCWKLVKAYEDTKTPFMFLENCCYGKNELLATNLVRKGMLGEIVYCHGAYRHDLRAQVADGNRMRHYRLRNYLKRNCDNYPTHDLGPIAKLLNVNRGNRMLSLVSIASKSRGMKDYLKTSVQSDDMAGINFMQGDVVETIITCADGTIISLKLDTTLPTPYSREFSIEGTRGFYSEVGNIIYEESKKLDKGEELNNYIGSAKDYDQYIPEIWKKITSEEIEAGHGGLDVLMLRDFFEATLYGEEMPIDVYDAASWMAISYLSETSIKNNGHPICIPDFTNGQWLIRPAKDIVNFKNT